MSATAYLLALAEADIAKGGNFEVVPKRSKSFRYPPREPDNISHEDDRAGEVTRAEEGTSPPGKRKAG